MKLLVPYILEVLQHQQQLILPDLGYFYFQDASASYCELTHVIQPPKRELCFKFDDNIKDSNQILSKHIDEVSNLSGISQFIKKQILLFKEQLFAFKFIEFDGLGVFRVDKKYGIVLEQTQNSRDLFNDDFGLQTLIIVPIKKNIHNSKKSKIKKRILTYQRSHTDLERNYNTNVNNFRQKSFVYVLGLIFLLLMGSVFVASNINSINKINTGKNYVFSFLNNYYQSISQSVNLSESLSGSNLRNSYYIVTKKSYDYKNIAFSIAKDYQQKGFNTNVLYHKIKNRYYISLQKVSHINKAEYLSKQFYYDKGLLTDIITL